jgi:hypothetical protein
MKYAKAAYAVDVNASKDQQPIKVQPHFLNYSNLTYGIEIAYPSKNWDKVEGVPSTERFDFPVAFFSTDDLSSILRSRIEIYIEKLPSFNVLLDEYTANQINTLKNDDKNFVLLKSNSTTLANNTAHEIIWTESMVKDGVIKGEIKSMQVFYNIRRQSI